MRVYYVSMTTNSEPRKRQLRAWIAEAETRIERDHLPLDDERGEPMSMTSSVLLLEMWRDELGQDDRPPMLGEPGSDFPG